MNSKIYKIISFIVAVIGFIGGIICGKVFQTATVKSAVLGTYEYHFNATLIISVWIGTILLFLIFFGIFAILSNQETIIAKLNKNNNTPKETDVKEIVAEEKIESSTPNIIEAVNNREPSANQIKCPHCGNIQSNNIQRCLRCSNLINE